MADSQDDSLIGKVVGGRYRLTQRLAAGGMGVVYRGERLQLGRPVAIKFLHPTFALRDDAMRRFETEAKAMGRLAHPHCVSVMDFGVESGMPFLVMEFVHGQTLREILDAGKLRLPRALAIFRQILAGVAHAHGQGIVHRDLKPANVMVTEATGTGDHVRILDFGLAKLHDSTAANDASHSNLAIGTPSYMAPEQARGEPVDARSDVYSLGVLLFELVTGEKPFFSDQAFEILAMHANATPPRLGERVEIAPSPELEAVVARALAKKPEDRFQTAADFAETLSVTPEAQDAGWRGLGQADTVAAPRMSSQARVPSQPPPSPVLESAPQRTGGGHPAWAITATVMFVGLLVIGWRYIESVKPPAPPGLAAPADAPPPPIPAATAPVAPEPPPVAPAAVATPPDAPPPPPPDAPPPDAAPPDAASNDDDKDDKDDEHDDASVPPEERGEPVAAVKPGPVRDEDIDTRKPAPPPRPVEPRTLAEAEALIAAGRGADAVSALERLKEQNPKSAYIPYLLGNLYFERMWWTDGLESYHDAIRLNRAYRSRAVLIKNAIRALSSAKTVGHARGLLVRDVGLAATPYLRLAARADPSAVVRARSSALLGEIGRKGKKK